MTISIATYYNDTYHELVERVYTLIYFKQSGMNTLVAFWRKYNFTNPAAERQANILNLESENEHLIFPNYSAMKLKYDLIEGGLAYESIVNRDTDVEISIFVDSIAIK